MTDSSNTPMEWVSPDPGVKRRVLAHNPEAMTVEVVFDSGAEGAVHSHPHVQTIHVRSGVFDFIVAGEKQRVGAGDSLVIPSNAEHGCVCVEAGALLDSFVPRRDDFL